MGRSYEMKEGKRVIIPTQRQIEAMERKQAEANVIKDEQGRTGMVNTVDDIDSIEGYLEQLGISKKEQKEIMENGKATETFIDINVLRILKAIRDGKVTNEMLDKKFKFAIDKLIAKWANSEVEMMSAYDKNGMFLGYNTIGDKGKVYIQTAQGQLVGGTTLHSHPSEEGRFFGGNFSVGDWKTFLYTGERKMVVTSKEGVYTLERVGPVKLTVSDINKSYVRTTVRTVLSTRNIKNDKTTKFGCSKTDLAVWRDQHVGSKELAAQAGIRYTFTPHKGFEGIDK